MACATLKRPLEWSDPSMSPPRDGISSTANQDSNSPKSGHPFGHIQRPAKRRCLNHISMMVPPAKQKEPSPFGDVQPKITSENIAATIRDEMLRLYHRKKLNSINAQTGQAQSPPNCGSTESCQIQLPNSICSQDVSSDCSSSLGLMSPSRRDAPLFTFRQVGLICERLLKERETQIRQEYDQVLTTKLAEQYDTFVKFTYDQIQKRFENGTIPSYLS